MALSGFLTPAIMIVIAWVKGLGVRLHGLCMTIEILNFEPRHEFRVRFVSRDFKLPAKWYIDMISVMTKWSERT